MIPRVTDNVTISEASKAANKVKPDCPHTPALSSLILSAMLMAAYRDEHSEIRIAYGIDGYLLNGGRMQARTGLSTTTVHDLPLADDCALDSTIEEVLQQSMGLLAPRYAQFRLTIHACKTAIVNQPPLNANYNSPRITVNDRQLRTVNHFAYLRSTLLRGTNIDYEVVRRLFKTSQAFSWSQASLRNRQSLQLNTELKIYKAVVLKILQNERSPRLSTQKFQEINHFHVSYPSRILRLSQDMTPDMEALERTRTPSIHAMSSQL
nr:unnamed protein product [Spirometra erinaceieuropaei]